MYMYNSRQDHVFSQAKPYYYYYCYYYYYSLILSSPVTDG